MGYGIWEMGTKPLGSGAADPAAAAPRKGRHRLPGGKCRQMGDESKAAIQYEVFESFKWQLTMNDQVCPVDLDVRT
jgi:hypothetical protein